MTIGQRFRLLREQRNLTQGDIKNRTGLLRCYLSRVENSHTVPTVETLEKLARSIEVPIYYLFYDSDALPPPPRPLHSKADDHVAFGSAGQDAYYLHSLRRLLGKITPSDRRLLYSLAKQMARRVR
jgi:transcriptional regulator with XRE-family HTH domain